MWQGKTANTFFRTKHKTSHISRLSSWFASDTARPACPMCYEEDIHKIFPCSLHLRSFESHTSSSKPRVGGGGVRCEFTVLIWCTGRVLPYMLLLRADQGWEGALKHLKCISHCVSASKSCSVFVTLYYVCIYIYIYTTSSKAEDNKYYIDPVRTAQ